MWVFVIKLKMPKVQLWHQAGASIFTYQKFISLKTGVHISFVAKVVLFKRCGT